MKFSLFGSGRGALDAGSTSAKSDIVLGAGTWQLTGQSVRGAAHVRSGRPNQDAIAWKALREGGGEQLMASGLVESPTIVSAVADGHGGERHPRSEWGAQFGVEEAVAALERFVVEMRGKSLSAVRSAAKKKLPRRIAGAWRQRVDSHLGNERGPERYVPYGATLIACAVTDRYVLYLQLGDGDILAVQPNGEVTRPIPRVQPPTGRKETSSLCQDICEGLFRVAVEPVSELPSDGTPEAPSLIMLATDGCANGFASEYEFQDVGRDLWQMAEQHSLDAVRQRLDSWLEETSQAGGGDDVTVAVIRRIPPLVGIEQPAATLPAVVISPPPLPPPRAQIDLSLRVRRLQQALAASLGLWLVTVIVGLATLPGSSSDKKPVNVEANRPAAATTSGKPGSPPAAPGSRPNAPAGTVPTTVSGSAATPVAAMSSTRRRASRMRAAESRTRRLSRARARTVAPEAAPRARKPRTRN